MAAIGFVPTPARFRFITHDDNASRVGKVDTVNGAESMKVPEGGIDDFREMYPETTDNEEAEDYVFDDDDDEEDDEEEEEEEEDDDEYDEQEDVVDDDDEEGDIEEDENFDDDGDAEGRVLVLLTLGKKGGEDYHEYQTWTRGETSRDFAAAKAKLAKRALEDLSLLEYIEENGDITSVDYDWEVKMPAECNVDRYLAGLLWTLQTYQDGVCPSYSYNYGKCLAPTGRVIEDYFNQAMQENRKVGAQELLKDFFAGGSISAGAACLAALPTSVKNLVPKPYSLIDSGTVENIYGECMDPHDNFFDLQKFERLADQEVAKITAKGKVDRIEDENKCSDTPELGRRIILGDHYWSVLSRTQEAMEHPFEPPLPPSEMFSRLRPNPRIRATRIISMDCPRPRPGWNSSISEQHFLGDQSNRHFQGSWLSKHNIEVDHMDFGDLINENQTSLLDIPYKIAFESSPDTSSMHLGGKQRFEILESNSLEFLPPPSKTNDKNGHQDKASSRTKDTGITLVNSDNQNSMVVLKQLNDIGVVSYYEFSEIPASPEYTEGITLALSKNKVEGGVPSKDLSFTRYRRVREPKKWTKQYLTALALDEMIRDRKTEYDSANVSWYDLSFDELKDLFTSESIKVPLNASVLVNPRNQSAVSLLNQLRDHGLIGEFEYSHESAESEEDAFDMTLTLSQGSVKRILSEKLIFTSSRKPGDSKRAIKQHLASMALDSLLLNAVRGCEGGSHEPKSHWFELTFEEIKDQLKLCHS
jgi:hypothetical protein